MARREPITPPPATQARYSLLVAAGANGQTAGDDRWGRGVVWTPEGCGAGGVVPAACGVVPDRNAPDRSGQAYGDPFYVWAADECDAQGFAARDWQGRARRRLEATQSYQVAAELWAGALTLHEASEGNIDTPASFLASTDQVVDENMDAARAIGVAEALAMACSEGRRIMVHVPVAVLERAMTVSQYLLRDTGGIITTAMGNIVVADAGYSGTGPVGPDGGNTPDNSTQWIYATQLVQVRLGAVEMLPNSLRDALGWAQALDRGTNDVTVWAQRLALYQLDPCCRIALSTDVPALPTIDTL